MYTSNRFLAVFALGPDRLLAPTNQPQYHLGNTRKRKLDLKKKRNRVILKDYCISEAYNPEHAHNYSSLAYATTFAPIFSRKNGSCSMMYIKMNSKYHRNIKYYFLVSIYYLPVFENFLTVKFKKKNAISVHM